MVFYVHPWHKKLAVLGRRKEGIDCAVLERRNRLLKNKKIDAELENMCKFCQYAAPLVDNDRLLCGKKGIVSAEYVCKKFAYDPLKREPKRLCKEVRLEYVEI